MSSKITLPLLAAAFAALTLSPASAGPQQEAVIKKLAAEAGVSSFSAQNGKALFLGTQIGGKPETPSCTICHTNDPRKAGKTRVGKLIEPMAVSVTPSRFTDPEKLAKWFRRNCTSVLGRECTTTEKGEILTYLNGL